MVLLPLLLVVIVVAAVVAGGRRSHHGPRPEVREVPMAPRVDGGSGGAGTGWGLALSLGRSEGVRLARHPAVLLGVALSLAGFFFSEGSAVAAETAVVQAGLAAFPLAGMTLIAANVAVLRSRRDGTDEQLAATPATARARTIGHVLSLAGPMAVMAALLVVAWVTLATGGPAAADLGFAHALELATGVVLVGCAGCCGILLARWFPSAIVAPIAVVALGFMEGFLGTSPQPETNRMRFLGWWTPQPESTPWALWPREPGWHLLYLVGLGLLVVAVALLRHGASRGPLGLLAGAAAVVGISGVVQVQPMTASEVANAASWIAEPEAHQQCEDSAGVTTCHYPGYDFSAEWRAVAEGVRAGLPDQARADVVARQAPGPRTLERLAPAVRDRLPATLAQSRQAPAGDRALRLHPELRWAAGDRGSAELALGVNLAAQALGLPSHDAAACTAGGQARGAVALWLAAQAGPAAVDRLRRQAATTPQVELGGMEGVERGETLDEVFGTLWFTPGPDHWSMDVPLPLVFWAEDVAVAAALTERPAGDVRAALGEHWDTIRDPGTSTGELARLVGVPPPAGMDQLAAGIGVSPSDLAQLLEQLPPPCR